jgi:hypothetical protein
MTIKEQIKARAEKEFPNTHTLVQNALNHFMRIDRNSENREVYTKGAEDMLPVMEALEQDNARMREALERMAYWTDEQASWQDIGVAARDISQKALNQK